MPACTAGTALALAMVPANAAAAMRRIESRMVCSPRDKVKKRRDRKEAPCPKQGASENCRQNIKTMMCLVI
jgi:hypothetical protein